VSVYSLVLSSYWTGTTGRQHRAIGSDAQVLALYSITSPAANLYGVYYVSPAQMQYETGLSAERVRQLLGTFQEQDFAYYDWRTEWMWIKKMARWQLCPTKPLKTGDLRLIGLSRWYQSCPLNPWLGPFYDTYSTLFALSQRRPTENESRGLPPLPPPASDSSLIVSGAVVEPPKSLATSRTARFAEWWTRYPKKRGKSAAYSEFEKLPLTDALFERMLVTLERQRISSEWLKESGRYIPDPARYLSRGHHLDELEVERVVVSEEEIDTAVSVSQWMSQKGRKE
jgi:hypothetical protein